MTEDEFEEEVYQKLIVDDSKENSVEKIFEAIEDYIRDEHHRRAILIDGAWGTGKTYFINDRIINLLKRNYDYKLPSKAIGLVSLYGIYSKEEFDKAVFNSLFPITNESNKNILLSIKQMFSNLMKKVFVDTGLKAIDVLSSYLTTDNILNNINAVLIFDDLERCKIPVSETFGYINTYIEQKNKKIIILANSKYFNPNEEDGNNSNETILSDYIKSKEKCVELELKFNNSINNVFIDIIDKNVNFELSKKFFTSNLEAIIDELSKYKDLNLRTVIFIVQTLDKFINTIFNKEFDEEFLNIHLLKICLYLMNKKIGKEAYKSIIKHNSMENYINKGVVDGDGFYKELKIYEKEYFINKKSSLSKLRNWRTLDIISINNLIRTLKNELKDDKYNAISFPEITLVLLTLTKLRIKYLPFKEMMKFTISSIGYDNYYITENWSDSISNDKFIQEKYLKIKEIIFRHIQIKLENKYLEISSSLNKTWDASFVTFCKTKTMFYLNLNKFLYYLDLDKIIFFNLTSSEIFYFLEGIKNVYSKKGVVAYIDKDRFKDDIPNINKIIDLFEKHKTIPNIDLVLKLNIEELVEYLIKIKTEIEKSKSDVII